MLQFPTSFSPDGKRLVYAEANPGAGASLRTVEVSEREGKLYANQSELLTRLPSVNAFATFSRDGQWLAYASPDSGIYEVYVRRYPDNGSQSQVSTGGGTMPVWNSKANQLFYRTEDDRIMVVDYKVVNGSFVPDKAREWVPNRLANLGLTPNLDIFENGRRFAVLMSTAGSDPPEARRYETFVVNFVDELRRRAYGR